MFEEKQKAEELAAKLMLRQNCAFGALKINKILFGKNGWKMAYYPPGTRPQNPKTRMRYGFTRLTQTRKTRYPHFRNPHAGSQP